MQVLSYSAGYFIGLFFVAMEHSVPVHRDPVNGYLIAVGLVLSLALLMFLLSRADVKDKLPLLILSSLPVCFESARRMASSNAYSHLDFGSGLALAVLPLGLVIYISVLMTKQEV